MSKYDENKQLRCSFCGKPQSQVTRLVAGPGVYICDECIQVCLDIINDGVQSEQMPDSGEKVYKLPKPKEISEILSEYVIEQDRAKRALAVAVYNHYKRINGKKTAEEDGVELQKSNIVMIGPTGSGKTLLAQTLAKILDVPFAIADATALTEAGYVGEDVENILLKLLQAADYDVEKAQKGIIYVDEIDKIASGSRMTSGADVSREGVQRDILPIVEGSVINTKYGPVKTDHILFIGAGAFHTAKPTDLIPELQGRFPIRVELESLTKEDFVNILTVPENALIKQHKALLETEGIEVEFTEGAIDEIATMSYLMNEQTENIGARRLHTVLEKLLEEISFNIPEMEEEKIEITDEYVKEKFQETVHKEDLDRFIL